jgi:hypothetical protein
MIKQKPIVNEENNNAEYWKSKFNDLLKKVQSDVAYIPATQPTGNFSNVLTA